MATTKKPDHRQDLDRLSEQAASAPPRARVTARVRPEDEERYALALESINHGVYDWDIVNSTVYYSPLLRAIFGMTDDQMLTPEESGQPHPSR